MAHETPTITAERRDRVGTRYAHRLRRSGRLPAVIYGHKTDPLPISVDEKEILTLIRHGAHVLNVQVDGASTETCLVKDLQYGYLGDNVIHLDFTRVNLDEEVTVHVHLHYVGEAEEAKRPGAILSHDLTELEVRCKVNDIPEEIRVELSQMEGTLLTVGELALPPGLVTTLDPNQPVAHVAFVKRMAVAEEEEVEAAAEPEVITEAKKEEEGQEPGAPAAE